VKLTLSTALTPPKFFRAASTTSGAPACPDPVSSLITSRVATGATGS
jgi:hypothetical protein